VIHVTWLAPSLHLDGHIQASGEGQRGHHSRNNLVHSGVNYGFEERTEVIHLSCISGNCTLFIHFLKVILLCIWRRQ